MSAAPTYGFNSLGLQLALAGVLGASISVGTRRTESSESIELIRRTARFNRSIKMGLRYSRTHRMYLTKPR